MATGAEQQILDILWRACKRFHEGEPDSRLKNPLLALLFLRLISNRWHISLNETHEPGRLSETNRGKTLLLPAGCDFQSLFQARDSYDLGERLNRAFAKMEQANLNLLDGVFRHINFDSEALLSHRSIRNERLRELLGDLNHPCLGFGASSKKSTQTLNHAFATLANNLISMSAGKGRAWCTPPEVAQLMAKILNPGPTETICDPACGSGNLLLQLARHSCTDASRLFGQEGNRSHWALCKLNLILQGFSDGHIAYGDVLSAPQFLDQDELRTFDVVATNPPFSLDHWGADTASLDPYKRYHRGLPPRTKGDYAFISHVVETMHREHGRAAISAPHGVLFRGTTEVKIRRKLVSEGLLDAVIGLPPNLFYETDQAVVMLIFKRNREDNRTLFIDASQGYQIKRRQNHLRQEDIEQIVATYQARQSIPHYAYMADFEELQANDYDLSIARYIDPFDLETEMDATSIQADIDQLVQELRNIREEAREVIDSKLI